MITRDGIAVPVLVACTVPGCVAGQWVYPGGEADHQAATGHAPVAGRPLCPVLAVG
jgi:hypothetical protein